MLRHVWSVLCLKSLIDVESKNISLFEVVEQVQFNPATELVRDEKPQSRPTVGFEWVTLWTRGEDNKPTRGLARDRVLSPSGIYISGGEYEVALVQSERMRIRRMVNMSFQESGKHEFCTEVMDGKTWKEVSRIPLAVLAEVKPHKRSRIRS